MSARASQKHAAGFALVEAIASLVIMGMVSLMIVEGIGAGRRVWERIDTREAAGETLDSAQTMLRDRIEQIYAATIFDRNPPYVDFDGQSQRLVFLANPPQSERPAPLRRYTLGLNTKGQLVLASVSDVAPPGAPPALQVLLQNVRRFDLAYFGTSDQEQLRAWRSQWRQESALPELVRVRLEFEPGDRRWWPDLLIHPQVTIDSACKLNPITSRCKGRL